MTKRNKNLCNLFPSGASQSDGPDKTRLSLAEEKQRSYPIRSCSFWVGLLYGLRNQGNPIKQRNIERRAEEENEMGLYPLTKLPDLTTRPGLTLQQSRQWIYHKLVCAFSFFLLFMCGKSVECLETRSPCGNGELTSHLHKFRWCIIIKGSRGECVLFKQDSVPAARASLLGLTLAPSAPVIPGNPCRPGLPWTESESDMLHMQHKKNPKQNKWLAHLRRKVAAWSRENPWQKKNLQTKKHPLRET